MWCTSIPDNGYFNHSCQHGPPYHEILVSITRKYNRASFRWLDSDKNPIVLQPAEPVK
jgi:hypothetical protein